MLTTNLHPVPKLRFRAIFSHLLRFKDMEVIFITFVATCVIVRLADEPFVRVFIQSYLLSF